MEKWLIRAGFVLLAFALSHAPAHAQLPAITVYFDRGLTQTQKDCPGLLVQDTLYVAVSGFTSPVQGFEYMIELPYPIMLMSELDPPNCLSIGNSYYDGRSVAFVSPIDASTPVLIQELPVMWICDGGCEDPDSHDQRVIVRPHPVTGYLRAVTSDLAFVDMVGMTSIVCPQPLCLGSCAEPVRGATSPRGVAIAGTQCELTCPAGDGGVIVPGDLPPEVHTTDVDGDGVVWLYDFSWLFSGYLMGPTPDTDFDCNGATNLIDFVLFTGHWQHETEVRTETTSWGSVKARYRK